MRGKVGINTKDELQYQLQKVSRLWMQEEEKEK
jgi:hypothetical protein